MKTKILIALVASLCIVGLIKLKTEAENKFKKQELSLKSIKEKIEINTILLSQAPEAFSLKTDLEKAFYLRNFIHKNFNSETKKALGKDRERSSFYKFFYNLEGPCYCGCKARALKSALDFFGIINRKVLFFYKNTVHASLEAKIGGRWVILDPSYNISVLSQTGKYLGYSDREDLVNGKTATNNYTSILENELTGLVGMGLPEMSLLQYITNRKTNIISCGYRDNITKTVGVNSGSTTQNTLITQEPKIINLLPENKDKLDFYLAHCR